MRDSRRGDVCGRLLERGPRAAVEEALAEWVERRDPSACYHKLSRLTPTYHGWSVEVSRSEYYYKTLPGRSTVRLPEPQRVSGVDALEAIKGRKSRRSYSKAPLTLEAVSTLLYYTLGVTGRASWGGPKRAYPSAGGLQPVEAYLVASSVTGLEPGAYHYEPGSHSLELMRGGRFEGELYEACLGQDHVREAPLNVVLTIVYSRTASEYGVRAYRYALMDAGFAGENLYLASEALGLATVAVGAFYDDMVCGLLDLDCRWEYPVLVFPVGWRRRY